MRRGNNKIVEEEGNKKENGEGLVKHCVKRRRGRQKKRWENNIADWTGLKFCDAAREAENKIKWRERVATSVAPQRLLTA